VYSINAAPAHPCRAAEKLRPGLTPLPVTPGTVLVDPGMGCILLVDNVLIKRQYNCDIGLVEGKRSSRALGSARGASREAGQGAQDADRARLAARPPRPGGRRPSSSAAPSSGRTNPHE